MNSDSITNMRALVGLEFQPAFAVRERAQSLRIVETDLNDARLSNFVVEHPDANVYHHPAWLRTLGAEYDRKVTVLACEGQDRRLCGILPLMYTRGLPVPLSGELSAARLSSLPRTPIAGPLVTSREALRLLLRAAIDRVSSPPQVSIQIKTEGLLPDAVIEGFSEVPWRSSYVISLPSDPAQLQVGSSTSQRARIRWSIKKAQRLGLRVRMANSEKDLRDWYKFYLENMRRITIPPRPLRVFLNMWRHLEPLGMMKVMLAERQVETRTELIAGSIFLMHGKRVFYAFTACPAQYFSLRPQDLIQWEAIHWAARNHFREYDLGEVPADDNQLASFKAKWGAEERLLYRYYYPQITSKSDHSTEVSGRQRLLNRIWQHVPLGATAQIGDFFYSYL